MSQLYNIIYKYYRLLWSTSDLVICIAPYHGKHHSYGAQVWPVCNDGITQLPATHTRTVPAFAPQPQGVTTIWLVLTALTHEGLARVS